MSTKFFIIGYLRQLMSKKCRKWPFAKVYARERLDIFSNFLIFHYMLKLRRFKEFTTNAFNCNFLIDKYVSRYIIKTNDVNL